MAKKIEVPVKGAHSRKQLKAHHGNAQHHEHHARGAVEGLGLRTVGKDCGDTRPCPQKM